MQRSRCCSEEWPACNERSSKEVQRPILFFVASKENGPPTTAVAASTFRVRFYSSLPRRRTVSPAAVVAATSSASDSNFLSCKEEWPACIGRRGNDLPRPILIFVAAKKNGPPAVHPQRQPKLRLRLVRCCSDSGFHGSIWESLQGLPEFWPWDCSDS